MTENKYWFYKAVTGFGFFLEKTGSRSRYFEETYWQRSSKGILEFSTTILPGDLGPNFWILSWNLYDRTCWGTSSSMESMSWEAKVLWITSRNIAPKTGQWLSDAAWPGSPLSIALGMQKESSSVMIPWTKFPPFLNFHILFPFHLIMNW